CDRRGHGRVLLC
nr:immunoglobulin heavy chain junction region [Homo sapiens]